MFKTKEDELSDAELGLGSSIVHTSDCALVFRRRDDAASFSAWLAATLRRARLRAR